jgi:hypothetical protein
MKSTTRSSRSHRLAVLLAGLAAATLALPATAVTIDSFTTNQAAVTDPPGGSTVVTGGADIIGTQRNLTSDLLTLPVGPSGTGPVSGSVAAGALSVSVANTTPDSRGEVYVTWDGDATAANLNVTGLGGADLTAANTHNALRIRVNSASAGTEIVVDVHTSATASSRGFLRIPVAIAAPTDLFLTYKYDFVPTAASPATFSNVGAIEMRVRGTEITAAIDIVDTTGPSLSTNTKRDLDLANSPIVTPVLEGSTFKYRVTVGASSGLAEDLDLSDTVDPNTTLNAASVLATPVAIDDAYRTAGHVGLTIAAPGLLGNDFDPDANGSAPELVVAPASVGVFATTLGGSITTAADGSFTYEPPVNFHRTIDTFTYTLQDNDGQTATAVVKVAIGRRVWFVDDVHGGTNAGTRDNPFVTFTGTNVNGAGGTGDRDAEGDIIFMYAGAHSAQVELEASESLIGEGEGLLLDGQQVVAPGTDPTLTSATHGVVLATNNTVRGFTVGNTGASSFDIFGNAFTSLNLSNVVLNGAGGALSLTNGTVAATLDSVASTSGTHGMNLDTLVGNVTVTGATSLSSSIGLRINASPTLTTTFSSTGAFTGTAGTAVFASNGGTLNFTGTSNTANATNGAAVDLTSTSLGSGATFSTVSATTNASKGINLDTVTGTFTGSGGAISVTAGGGNAVDVNAGSSNISYAGTITSVAAARLVEITARTGGTTALSGNLSGTGSSTGINVANNTGGTINFTAGTKTLNTGANAAVTLATNTGATINFTGGGLDIDTTSGSGFTATAGATAISVQGTGNSINSGTGTALNVANSTIANTGLNFVSIAANGATNGINLDSTGANAGLTVSGSGSTTQGGDNSGGTIQSTGDAIRLNNTRNISLTNMRIQNVGTGIADAAGAIDATNIQGSNLFRAGTITGMGQAGGAGGTNRNGFNIINTDTNLTMFAVENSVFSNSDGTSSFFFSSARGTSNMGISITTSDFSDLVALAVQVNAGDTETGVHTVTSTISNNVFRNASAANGQGGLAVISSDQDATHNFTVSNNQFYDLIKGIAGGNSEIVLAQTTGGTLNGTFLGNTIGTAAFGNGDRRGIGVIAEPDVDVNGELGSIDIVIDGNIINRLTDREAIFVDLREDTTNSELIIRNNVIGQLAGFEGQVGGIREAIDVQNRGEVTRTLNIAVTNNNVRTTSSVWAVNLEVNIDNATPGNLTTHATVTGNTIRNTGTGDELIARPRDAGAVTTLCLDMTGNTLDSGAGVITLDETGVLNVEQASAAALAAANGIPGGNVSVSGSPSFGVACASPPV